MKYYFAPMEGITGYVYRNAYRTFFHPIDQYYTPFITPNPDGILSSRDYNDLLPEHNDGLTLIPQILTNQAESFLQTAQTIQHLGYREINLNLGCPSGTVVSKRRGAGFLAYPEELNQFLAEIFSRLDMQISIKTRIGKTSPDEFDALLEIFSQYPLKELIIHPRIQTDFYRNRPNYTVFQRALSCNRHPICYNGDLFTPSDYETVTHTFPALKAVMFGRGLIANPGLVGRISKQTTLNQKLVQEFHTRLYADYRSILHGVRPVLFKMKELWRYLLVLFPHAEKVGKRIKKSQTLADYEGAVSSLFQNYPLNPDAGYLP